MNNEQIIQEATEAIEKNLNAGCYVEELLRIVKEQKTEIAKKDTEIDILIRKKEALRDEIAEQQAENERLKNAYKQCAWERDVFSDKDAEIDRLKESNKRLGGQMGSLIHHLETAKSEAYREFAEKVKTKKFTHKNFGELVYVEEIDTTLKELTRNLHGTCTESK